MTTRRNFVTGAGALAGWSLLHWGSAGAAGLPDTLAADLARIEFESGGRLGVAVHGHGFRREDRASRQRALSDVQHVQACRRCGRAQARRGRQGAARPAHRVPGERHRRQFVVHQGAGGRRRHDARGNLRGCHDRERQHRGQPDPRDPGRAGGLHGLCPLARRQHHAPRPYRTRTQRSPARRPARHHDAACHARQRAEASARRYAVRRIAGATDQMDARQQDR